MSITANRQFYSMNLKVGVLFSLTPSYCQHFIQNKRVTASRACNIQMLIVFIVHHFTSASCILYGEKKQFDES